MSSRPRDLTDAVDRVPMDPEDVLRIVRRVGLGLLIASLFVDAAADRWLRAWMRVAALQYRVVPNVEGPGVALADMAIELLDATSRGRDR